MGSDWPELAGLAAKMDREEHYHRLHARMWLEKLEGNRAFEAALAELWPYALGVLDPDQRGELATLVGRDRGRGGRARHARLRLRRRCTRR